MAGRCSNKPRLGKYPARVCPNKKSGSGPSAPMRRHPGGSSSSDLGIWRFEHSARCAMRIHLAYTYTFTCVYSLLIHIHSHALMGQLRVPIKAFFDVSPWGLVKKGLNWHSNLHGPLLKVSQSLWVKTFCSQSGAAALRSVLLSAGHCCPVAHSEPRKNVPLQGPSCAALQRPFSASEGIGGGRAEPRKKRVAA
jgi:hypothetical protein